MTYSNDKLLAALQRRGEEFGSRGQHATAKNNLSTATCFRAFLVWSELSRRPFGAATVRLFSAYLRTERAVSANTQAFYLRTLRAAWLAEGGDAAAFEGVNTGVSVVAREAPGPELIPQLRALELKGTRALVRDLFIFSFAARGMDYIDMAHLRHADLYANGYLRYQRRRTGQWVAVRLERASREILARWQTDPAASPYVFPILKAPAGVLEGEALEAFDASEEAHVQYASGLGSYNRTLHALGLELGCAGLTGYAARHSWATSARRAGVPVAVISEGMGHCSERTTRIYLASFEETLLDEANRRVLKHVGL